ncbi:uncharacterized protein LOC122376534 isoform X3 [Amphibalanus amphitrite]|uniref:uncharacterized protein LOC122376534 isoform X3 n=1 Tax=Amphibalanus amphitrite TaxID=1232801 RepID=UPI001C90E4FD|nr:uncharacterized protein LOC122376534 isoform X3 [Amphibalanus amphitrite]
MWLVNKTLVMTLCVGITFGFSFAYMVLTLAQYSPQGGFYDRLLGGRAREWFGPDRCHCFAPRLDGPLQLHTQPGSLTRSQCGCGARGTLGLRPGARRR